MDRFCPNCGVQLDNVALFCPRCGNSAAQPPFPPPRYSVPYTPVPPLSPKEQRRERVILACVLAGGFVLFAGVIAGVVLLFASLPG